MKGQTLESVALGILITIAVLVIAVNLPTSLYVFVMGVWLIGQVVILAATWRNPNWYKAIRKAS